MLTCRCPAGSVSGFYSHQHLTVGWWHKDDTKGEKRREQNEDSKEKERAKMSEEAKIGHVVKFTKSYKGAASVVPTFIDDNFR